MRVALAALATLLLTSSFAVADPCDTLIDITQSQLSQPDLSVDQKTVLESILNAGRAAKSSGDVAACEAAMTSSMDNAAPKMSVPTGEGAGGHKCSKSMNTV
jgi:hypothetical protein